MPTVPASRRLGAGTVGHFPRSDATQPIMENKMPIDWLCHVAADPRVTPAACRLAIVLRSHVISGNGSPSLQELAKQTRCTTRGVGKQLASLTAAGHIHIERPSRGRGRRNRYCMVGPLR